jgi:hypothetical protein
LKLSCGRASRSGVLELFPFQLPLRLLWTAGNQSPPLPALYLRKSQFAAFSTSNLVIFRWFLIDSFRSISLAPRALGFPMIGSQRVRGAGQPVLALWRSKVSLILLRHWQASLGFLFPCSIPLDADVHPWSWRCPDLPLRLRRTDLRVCDCHVPLYTVRCQPI